MEEKVWDCITKRLTGIETENSKSFLDQWLAEDVSHIQKYNEAKSLWELTAFIKPVIPEIPFGQIIKTIDPVLEQPKLRSANFWKYSIAAALTGAFLLIGLYYYRSNFKLSSASEMIVRKADAGSLIKIDLPDSSVVWLNAGSEISFDKHFDEHRVITLKGEAYFKVKHNKTLPFQVKSGKLTTTVLGTSFSIRAYGNEAHTSIAVKSGKVGVIKTGQHQEAAVMLLPNNKLTYDDQNKRFVKTTIQNKDVDAWTRGELSFIQTPFAEVIETISRTYHVKIEADTKRYAHCKLTAEFRNQPLKTVLRTFHIALNIESKQIGQTIYLKGGNCM